MKVGFIGLGLMGRGIAANIARAGHDLVVHDLRREAAAPLLELGARWADSPRELAAQSEVVFTSLPRPTDVAAVRTGEDGLDAGFRKGSAWFDLSTNSVDVVRQIHAELKEKDVEFLDAPVSGGPAGAASGKLAIWIGGERDVFDRFQPVLEAMGDQARYIGAIGAGSIAKLVHNTASTVMHHAIAEMMTVGVKAGLDPLPLYEAIRAGAAGRARAFDGVARRWLSDQLDPPNFALELLHKDVRLGVEMAASAGVPVRLAELALSNLTEALTRGWGKRDAQSAMALQEERAGLPKIAVPIAELEEMMKRS